MYNVQCRHICTCISPTQFMGRVETITVLWAYAETDGTLVIQLIDKNLGVVHTV